MVVNNAGFSHVAKVTDYSVEDWRALHETDLMGVFLGLKHTIRCSAARMRRRS